MIQRLEIVEAELHTLLAQQLSKVEQECARAKLRYGLFEKAGYSPNEPRDARGRWTAAGSEASNQSGWPLSDRTSGAFEPAVYRPEIDKPILIAAAGAEDDEREETGEEASDPTAELRTELYGWAYRELKTVDPDNPELVMLTSGSWVPSWENVQSLSNTLEAAKVTRNLELNGEPSPTIWELGWGARGVEAERMRGTTLPSNFPGIDRFASGVATSIKSIDLDAPSYGEPWQLEGRINYYVNRLASFNGAELGDSRITASQIRGRSLDLIVPRGSLSSDRVETIVRCQTRAQRLGIGIVTVEY